MSARQLLQLTTTRHERWAAKSACLAYETWGTLNARRDNCVCVH